MGRLALTVALALAFAGCAKKDTGGRGGGREVAPLPPSAKAKVYADALRASFDIGPGLSLLIDPRTLPPRGYGPGPELSEETIRRMVETGVFQGTCRPPAPPAGRAPRCEAPIPGYVVRVSEVFRLPKGDTVETYALSERYDVPGAESHAAFRLEEAYRLVRQEGRWKAVRKGRVAVQEGRR